MENCKYLTWLPLDKFGNMHMRHHHHNQGRDIPDTFLSFFCLFAFLLFGAIEHLTYEIYSFNKLWSEYHIVNYRENVIIILKLFINITYVLTFSSFDQSYFIWVKMTYRINSDDSVTPSTVSFGLTSTVWHKHKAAERALLDSVE